MKFAHFYSGNSHKFPFDPSVTDYVIGSRVAEELARVRKWDGALSAYIYLANTEKVGDFQKSDALQHAAVCACNLKDFERAEELADQIPIESVATTVRMHNLAAQRKWPEIVERFGGEDLRQWPFWQISAGAFVRGEGYYFTKQGEKVDTDLRLALSYEPDPRLQVSIRTMLAQNREAALGDDVSALELYRENFAGKRQIGGADEFRSVDRAAAILTKLGRFQEALATFDVVDFEKQTGFWLHEMSIAKADTLWAADRKDEAKELYRQVLEDDSASEAHRKRAAQAR